MKTSNSTCENGLSIDFLAHHPWCVTELAGHFYEHWRGYYDQRGVTPAAIRNALHERANLDSLPLAVVALREGVPVGTATIKPQDLDCRPDFTPWLAGVMVAPEYRRQGIATALVERIVEEALRLRLPRLYLWTPNSESMYTRLGWSRIEKIPYFGSEITIMKRELISRWEEGVDQFVGARGNLAI